MKQKPLFVMLLVLATILVCGCADDAVERQVKVLEKHSTFSREHSRWEYEIAMQYMDDGRAFVYSYTNSNMNADNVYYIVQNNTTYTMFVDSVDNIYAIDGQSVETYFDVAERRADIERQKE